MGPGQASASKRHMRVVGTGCPGNPKTLLTPTTADRHMQKDHCHHSLLGQNPRFQWTALCTGPCRLLLQAPALERMVRGGAGAEPRLVTARYSWGGPDLGSSGGSLRPQGPRQSRALLIPGSPQRPPSEPGETENLFNQLSGRRCASHTPVPGTPEGQPTPAIAAQQPRDSGRQTPASQAPRRDL